MFSSHVSSRASLFAATVVHVEGEEREASAAALQGALAWLAQ